jgi:GNAT superfamily N-acetyltransferase
MSTDGFIVRGATEDDFKAVSRLIVMESWRINPHDMACGYAFDPSAYFVGELNGEVISHINAVKYPGHSAYIGNYVVKKEHRGKGYGKQTWDAAWKSLDHDCTLSLDGVDSMVPKYESLGFQSVWKSSVAVIDLTKAVKVLSNITLPPGASCVPIRTIDFEKIFKYDTSIFGAPRRVLLEKYVNLPGSLGWAAVNEKGAVLGYNLVRQVVCEAGSKLTLCMTPLYADDDVVARALLKVAAETYLATDAVEGSNFILPYSDGGSYGDHASRLVVELEALTFNSNIGQRMYTKGTPPGSQFNKMYGIFYRAF